MLLQNNNTRLLPDSAEGQLTMHVEARSSKDGSGLRKSISGAFWRSIQPISLNIISLPVMAYIIRELGPAGYGTWNTSIALVATTSVITSLGLRGTFIRSVARDSASAPGAFADQLGTRILLATLAMAVSILSSLFLGYNSDVTYCTVIAAIGMVIGAIYTTASDLLESQQRLPATAVAAMAAGIVLTAASVVAIWFGAGPIGLSLAYLTGPITSLWIFFSILRRERFPIKANCDPRRAIRMMWESRHFTAQMLLSTVNSNVAMLMLPKLVGAARFGLFSAGALLVTRLAVFPDAIGTAFYPLIAKSIRVDQRIARRQALLGMLFAFAICIAVALPTTFLAGFVARVLFPKQPSDCKTIIMITIWALPLIGIRTMLSYSLNAAGMEARQARASFWASIFSLSLGAILIFRWELIGACWFMLLQPAFQIVFNSTHFIPAFLSPRSEPQLGAAPSPAIATAGYAYQGTVQTGIFEQYTRWLIQASRPSRTRIRNWVSHQNNLRKAITVPLDRLLMGGEQGIDARTYALMIDDLLRPSRKAIDGPHAALLRAYRQMGERIFTPEEFQKTSYFHNGAICADITGNYHQSELPNGSMTGPLDGIIWKARRFVRLFQQHEISPNQQVSGLKDPLEPVRIQPIRDSSCYTVIDGNHRIAIAALRNQRAIEAVPVGRPAYTPLQELLLGVYWTKGRRELYQPISSPELTDRWVLVRRCTDRLAMMKQFLSDCAFGPDVCRTYLDIAASYGWFVAQMSALGYEAYGVERDPFSCRIGMLAYGLAPSQMARAESTRFLTENQKVFDVVSCFSLLHHFVQGRGPISACEFIRMVDRATARVLFFDTGQVHEEMHRETLAGWTPDFIQEWLRENTSFSRIVQLGIDQDAQPPFHRQNGRTLFACIR
jgi:O-antigen/teichoic acid export membrane protein